MRGMRKWLRPGLRVKRYVLLLALGITLTSLALAMGLATAYRNLEFPDYSADFVQSVTLQFIDHPWREILVGVIGVLGIGLGIWYLSHSMIRPLLVGRTEGMADILWGYYKPGARGPKIVAIGGGTGLPTLLRGLKRRTGNLTAIVTMADDGGSTGRLREQFGVLPPGDFRNCIAALSDAEPLMQQLFQYRFERGGSELDGHSFGNLFITAMVDVTGDFERAVLESSRILNVQGRVFPSTLESIQLHAIAEDGTPLAGESAVGKAHGRIRKVFLAPEDPAGYAPAVQAVWDAEMIVYGPGSLYTSVIPPLLVDDLKHAIKANRNAIKVYICNVATQHGETDHFDALAHVKALHEQVGKRIFDYVLVNANLANSDKIKPEWQQDPVLPHSLIEAAAELGVEVFPADVVNDNNPLRHDPDKLAAALMRLYSRRSTSRVTELPATTADTGAAIAAD